MRVLRVLLVGIVVCAAVSVAQLRVTQHRSGVAAGGATTLDAYAHGSTASAGTSIPSFNLTIGSITNGSVIVGIGCSAATTSMTVTVGGSSASLVTGTDSAASNNYHTYIFAKATGSSTGSTAIAISWTGTASCAAEAVSFGTTNQTTPCTGGTSATGQNGVTGDPSLAITSQSNDLTFDVVTPASASNPSTPNQTQIEVFQGADFQTALATSYGTGAASVTHTWVVSSYSNWAQSGCSVQHL